MQTYSNRFEANVKWGEMTSVCTCCCVQGNTNIRKIFLRSNSFSDGPLDSSFLTLLYILLSVFDFITLFFGDFITVKSSQPERWNRGPSDPLLFFCGEKMSLLLLKYIPGILGETQLFIKRKEVSIKDWKFQTTIPTKYFRFICYQY